MAAKTGTPSLEPPQCVVCVGETQNSCPWRMQASTRGSGHCQCLQLHSWSSPLLHREITKEVLKYIGAVSFHPDHVPAVTGVAWYLWF
jgi:hypothetical protein